MRLMVDSNYYDMYFACIDHVIHLTCCLKVSTAGRVFKSKLYCDMNTENDQFLLYGTATNHDMNKRLLSGNVRINLDQYLQL